MASPDPGRASGVLGDLRGPAIGVVIGGFVCQMGLGFGYVFGPLARFVIEDLEWTRAMYSSARAPQLFVTALASPLVGLLVVRLGARRVLVAAIVVLGVSSGLVAGMNHLWQLYGLVMAMGLAITGLGDITVGHLVSQWIRRGRGLALGIVYTGSNVAGAVLPLVAVPLAVRGSWRDAFLAMAAAAFLGMLPLALWLVREPARGASAAGETPAAATASAEDARDLDLRQALRTRSFWILAFTLFTFFFFMLGVLEHLVLFLTDQGVPHERATGYFSAMVFLGVGSKIALGVLADRIPHKAALIADYVILAVSSLVLLALPDAVTPWVFVATFGFAYPARDVVYPLIVTHCFGVRYLAEIYGGLMLALLPGGALGPIVAAAVHDATGSYGPAFALFAGLNLAAVAALAWVRDERRAEPGILPAP